MTYDIQCTELRITMKITLQLHLMEFAIVNYNVDKISSSWHLGIVLNLNLLQNECKSCKRCW